MALPIAMAVLLAWWVSRQLGPAALAPDVVLSVVAVSLGFRLVFEQNLVGYYFMALAVSLVLLEAARGSIRGSVLAWFAGMTVVICKIGVLPFGGLIGGASLQTDVPRLIAVVALLAVLGDVFWRAGGRSARTTLPWLGVALCALLVVWPGDRNPFNRSHVIWFWQAVVVAPGLLLAAEPLLTKVRLPFRSTPGPPEAQTRHRVAAPPNR